MRLLIALFLASSGFANTVQPIMGSTGATNLGTAGGFLSLTQQAIVGVTATIGGQYAMLPVGSGGTFTGISAALQTDPGAGNTFTFTLYVEGADTSLAVSLTHVTKNSATGSVHVNGGQRVAIHNTTGGTPTNGTASWGVIFIPDVAGETMLFGSLASGTPSTQFNSLAGTGINNATESNIQVVIPSAGVFRKLSFWTETATGAATGVTDTVNINGAPSTLTVSANNVNTVQSDSTHIVAVTAGQKISLAQALTGSPGATAIDYSVIFVPSTLGQFIIPAARGGAPSTSATNFMPLGGRIFANATETNEQNIAPTAFAMKAVYVFSTTAPGAGASGKSFTFTLRDAGDTALTAQLFEVATVVNASASVSVAPQDLLSTKTVPAATPSTGVYAISYLGFIAPNPPINSFMSVLK